MFQRKVLLFLSCATSYLFLKDYIIHVNKMNQLKMFLSASTCVFVCLNYAISSLCFLSTGDIQKTRFVFKM